MKLNTFRRLCKVRELLAEVGDESMSIKDVARAVRMSPFHFIRQFEALFGVTPHQFRIRSRLDHARRLLAADRHSVTEVCMEVGMSSLGSFSDQFTRRVGETPSEYRERARAVIPQERFPGCLCLMSKLPASAFRNFREASAADLRLECEDANQADQHHGG
jgi:AraC-like DNA-binding protein